MFSTNTIYFMFMAIHGRGNRGMVLCVTQKGGVGCYLVTVISSRYENVIINVCIFSFLLAFS